VEELIAATEYALGRIAQSAYKFKETGDSLYGPCPVRAVDYSQRRFVLEAPSPVANTSNGISYGGVMLRWSAIFLVISLVAAIFGFGGIAVAAAGVARILFFVFLVLFLISLIGGVTFRRRI
jgi:uncharacterized membrane protein YtjA (UPF0391 family)